MLLGIVAALLLLVSGATGVAAAGSEWNIDRVGAPASSADVVIAVIDTGVDSTHPAFGGRVLPQLDFTGDGETGDPQGHGTHVAGTAAGGTVDCGDGPAAIGVAPNARILPVRVLDAEGSGRVGDVVMGIRAAADRGAEVINLSLGGDLSFLDGGGNEFRQAISYAWSKGSIPVLAAGNSGLLGGIFGSGYGDLDAVVVTATTNADRKAGYASSVGSATWGISAPGGDGSGQPGRDIRSAYPGDRCALLGGTSMAAPHVSGALAVLRSRGLDAREAVGRLMDTARPLNPRSTYGSGLADLDAAVRDLPAMAEAEAETVQPPTTAATTTPLSTTTSAPPSTVSAAPPSPPSIVTPDTATVPPEVSTSVPPTPEAADEEVAGSLTIETEPDGTPGAALVSAAVFGCAVCWAGAAQLLRIRGQP